MPSLPELVIFHSETIRKILTRRSGSAVLKRTTVEDLYQETISAALASASTFCYRDDSSFFSWMETIARRVIARQLGSRHSAFDPMRIRRDASTGIGIPEGQIFAAGRSPSSSAAVRESESALQRALEKLPDHYRRAIVYYEIEELPLAEVALRMKRTKGATCRILARAREKLHQLLST